MYLPRGLKGPTRESAKPPSHNSYTSCKATTRMKVIGKEKHCSLHSLQRMTVSPFTADTVGVGNKASFASQRAVLVITFRVCMGAGEVFPSLRNLSVNKEIVTLDIYDRVFQIGAVETAKIY